MDDKLSYTSSNSLVNLTHGLYGSGRQEKLYLCFSSGRVLEEMPAWCADHRVCGHSKQARHRHHVLCCSKDKRQTNKANTALMDIGAQGPPPLPPPPMIMTCSLAKKWCLSLLCKNNISVLISEYKFLSMQLSDPLHLRNRSYEEWIWPVSTLSWKPSVGRGRRRLNLPFVPSLLSFLDLKKRSFHL